FYCRQQLLYAKRFFDVRNTGSAQCSSSFFVDGVARDQQHAACQLRSVLRKPGMNVGSVDTTGRSHIGDDSQKFVALETLESLHAGLAGDYAVPVTFERGADVRHDGSLIFNDQDWQGCCDGDDTHAVPSPAARAMVMAGRRTANIAPATSVRLEATISPPCSRTIP